MVKAVIDTVGTSNVVDGVASVPVGCDYHHHHDLSPVRCVVWCVCVYVWCVCVHVWCVCMCMWCVYVYISVYIAYICVPRALTCTCNCDSNWGREVNHFLFFANTILIGGTRSMAISQCYNNGDW